MKTLNNIKNKAMAATLLASSLLYSNLSFAESFYTDELFQKHKQTIAEKYKHTDTVIDTEMIQKVTSWNLKVQLVHSRLASLEERSEILKTTFMAMSKLFKDEDIKKTTQLSVKIKDARACPHLIV